MLDALPVTTATVLGAPKLEPWVGQRLDAEVLRIVQIRNAKELIWKIVSVNQHGTVCGKAEKNQNT